MLPSREEAAGAAARYFENVDEMDKFLGRGNLPKLIQGETDYPNSAVSIE